MDNKKSKKLILVKLARFMTKNDKNELLKDLRSQENIFAKDDPWDTSKRLLIDHVNESELDHICSKLITYPGVSNINYFTYDCFNI